MIQKQTDSATVRGPPGPTIIIYKELIRVQQQRKSLCENTKNQESEKPVVLLCFRWTIYLKLMF